MNILKLTGIVGLVGAVLCGTGEFLLHFDPQARFSGYDFMADISDARLTTGHFFAVIGVPLYFVGVWHIAEMLKPADVLRVARIQRGDRNSVCLDDSWHHANDLISWRLFAVFATN